MRDNDFVMRIKNILSTAAFVIAFISSAFIAAVFTPQTAASLVAPPAAYDRATAQNITRFLQRDIQNGYERNDSSYSYKDDSALSSPYVAKRASAVSEYSDASGAMEYNHLPQDFQLAWLKHMRAWHKYADFLQKAKAERTSYAEISRLENQYNQDINTTWFEVLRIGRTYGSFVSEY